jgi:hypothetical protein
MPKELVVGNSVFEFPELGDNPDYGEQVTDWATAVTDALQTVQQPNDIATTIAAINNNVSVASPINGFSFDPSEVLSFTATYYLERSTVTPATNVVENGTITGNFDGTTWSIAYERVGFTGVNFTMTAGGQVNYTSTNVTGSSYAGRIIFTAKVINNP